VCSGTAGRTGAPACDLDGIGREVRAAALDPSGRLAGLALAGLRPRIEVYDVEKEPRLLWQCLFPENSGGPMEIAFSADGRWIVALSARGRMHRFDAVTGGNHLSVESKGQTARAIPPGRIMAVAGDQGEVTLWYLEDGTIAWRLPPRRKRGPVDHLAASGEGSRFATLEYEEQKTVIRIWEVKRRKMLAQIEVEDREVADVALDSAGKTLYLAHEKKGLLATPVAAEAKLKSAGGKIGRECRGRLLWLPTPGHLSCTMRQGVVQLDHRGKEIRRLNTGVQAGNWIVAAAANGERLIAVGDGHLLVWWLD
jgi:hypothetical protein